MRTILFSALLVSGAASAAPYANLFARNADLPVINALRDDVTTIGTYLDGLLKFNKLGACGDPVETFELGSPGDFDRFVEAAQSRGFAVKTLATFKGSDNNGDTSRPFVRVTRGDEVLYAVGYGASKVSWMKLALCPLKR